MYKLFLLLFLSLTLIYAQNDLDLLQDIEATTKIKTTKNKVKIIKKDFSLSHGGYFSTFYSYNLNNSSYRHSSRFSYFLEKKLTNSTNFRGEFRLLNSQLSTTIENRNTQTGAITENTSTISNAEFEVRDLYLDYLYKSWNLTIGYRTYSLGQSSISSVLDFLIIPNRSDSYGLSLNKLDEKLTQFAIILAYNKNDWNFKYTYHPFFEIDSFFKQNLTQKIYNSVDINGKRTDTPISPKIPKADRHLFQVFYYGAKYTFGLTYYSGLTSAPFTFYPNQFLVETDEIDPGKTFYERISLGNNFDDIDTLALEFSYTLGKFRYFIDLGVLLGSSILLPDMHFNDDDNHSKAYRDYIINKNNGSFLLKDQGFLFTNFGFDYTGERHYINLFIIAISFTDGSHLEEARTAYQKSVNLLKLEDELKNTTASFAFPTIHWSYFLQKEKTSAIGLVAGSLATSRGAGIYYKKDVNDRLTFSLALSSLQQNNDNVVFERDEEEEEITIKDEFNTSISFFLKYKI